jgi:tRNA nucleotidyltransferase (CCA-adding enzyme)
VKHLPILAQRLAYLFIKGNLTGQALSIMKTLKYDRKTMDQVKQLMEIVGRLQKKRDKKELLQTFIAFNGEQGLQGVAISDLLEVEPILQKAIHVYNKMRVKQLRDLAVKGDDLVQSMEHKPGPWIHQVLTELALEVNLELLPNEKKSLIERAKKIHYDIT